MTAAALDLLEAVSAAGGTVRLDGETLRLSAHEPLPDDLRARVRQHKAEIVALLAAAEPAHDAVPAPVTDDQADRDLPAEVADGVWAILTAHGARGVPPNRWPQIQRDTQHLVERRWLHAALHLGWSTPDLFGCDQRAPWYRLDRSGLVLLVGGHEIVEFSSDMATLRTRTGSVLRFRRSPPAKPPVALLWEVLTQTVHRTGWRPAQATGPPISVPTAHPKERMAATYLAGPRRHPDHDHS
jgi:TubC N-terminal docking domain